MNPRPKLYIFAVCIAMVIAACDSTAPPPVMQGAIVPTRVTPTPSPTATETATFTPSPTLTATATLTATLTSTATNTLVATFTPSAVPHTTTPEPTDVQASPTAEADITVTPTITHIQYGNTVTGTIDDTNPRAFFSFDGRAGDRVNIRMTADSGELDPYLKLLDSADNVLIENDDENSSVSRDSFINGYELPEDGVYTIVATRFQEDLGTFGGDFTLRLTSGTELPPTPDGAPPADGVIRYGQEVRGTINQENGAVRYTFIGKAGDVVNIRMNTLSNSLDPLLILQGPNGEALIENDDDDAGGRNSFIERFELPVDGEYTIVATRFQGNLGGTTGEFTVSLELVGGGGEGSGNPPPIGVLPEIEDEVTLGGSISGSITTENPLVYYGYQGKSGDVISISLSADDSEIDPLLMLLDTNGRELARNDDTSRASRDSVIDNIRLPHDGEYFILATRSPRRSGESTGGFRLLVYEGNGAATVLAILPIPLEYGHEAEVPLTQNRDEAVFVFFGHANDVLQLTIERTRGNVVTQFVLVNPAGAVLVARGDEEQAEFTLPIDGYYSLLVIGRRGQGGVAVRLEKE